MWLPPMGFGPSGFNGHPAHLFMSKASLEAVFFKSPVGVQGYKGPRVNCKFCDQQVANHQQLRRKHILACSRFSSHGFSRFHLWVARHHPSELRTIAADDKQCQEWKAELKQLLEQRPELSTASSQAQGFAFRSIFTSLPPAPQG